MMTDYKKFDLNIESILEHWKVFHAIRENIAFFRQLEKLNIEWKELEKYNFETPGLLIGTIHGTKGLECETIIIPEVNNFRSGIDRQLLYVAITRSRKKLILSAHKSTLLIKSFQESQNSDSNSTDKA